MSFSAHFVAAFFLLAQIVIYSVSCGRTLSGVRHIHRLDAGGYGRTVIEERTVCQLEQGTDGTGLGVSAAVDDPVQAAVDDGPGTHRAGFAGNVERAARQAPPAQDAAGLFDGQQFGMGCGTWQAFPQVVGTGNGFLLINNHGADRDFTDSIGRFGFFQGFAHIKFIFCHNDVLDSFWYS